jgi:uncharacterized membrane protein YidH (DUF202 family)
VSAPRDLGLQGERTSLAWSRTALAMSVAALVVTRYGVVRHDAALTAAGVLLLVAAAATWPGARRRQVHIADAIREGRSPVSRKAIRGVAALTVGVGAVSIWAILSQR